MAARPLLPTFFVIGAAKAGTTGLNNYLALHPQIAMADPREPHLMIGPRWRQRVEEYARHFKYQAPIRGDCSPRYSVYPWNPLVSEHIAALVPEARLVYVVRDPVERTIAAYAQSVMHGSERRTFEAAIQDRDPANYYLAGSRYATQVEIYLRRFDADQLLVVDQAHLRSDRELTMQRVFEHVGADPGFRSREFALEHNVRGRDNVSLGKWGTRLKQSRLNRLSRRILPASGRRRLVAAARLGLGRGAVSPAVDADVRAMLAEELAPEAERLRRLTGQRFATWSV